MTISRYNRDLFIKNREMIGTATAIRDIRSAIKRGIIDFTLSISQENDRLDVIAGRLYGDARLWWVIACASNIGWGLQVPPGTRLVIPDIEQIKALVG